MSRGNNIAGNVTLGQKRPGALVLGGRNEANSRRERGFAEDMLLSVNDFMAQRMKTYRKTDGGPQTRRVRDRKRARKMELDSVSYIFHQRWT